MNIFKTNDPYFLEWAFRALKGYELGETEGFKVCTTDLKTIRNIKNMAPYLQAFHITTEKRNPKGFSDWSRWQVCLEPSQESAHPQSSLLKDAFQAFEEYSTGKFEDFSVCTYGSTAGKDFKKMAPYLRTFHIAKRKISPGFWSQWQVCLQSPLSTETNLFLKAAHQAERQAAQDKDHYFSECTTNRETIRAFHSLVRTRVLEDRKFFTDDGEGICVFSPAARQDTLRKGLFNKLDPRILEQMKKAFK